MANPPAQPAQPAKRSLPRLIATALLALIVLVGITVLIIWLVIKPKRLVYSVEDGSVHGFNLSHNRLNASFDFVVRSYNPNHRVSVYYDSVEVSVVYKEQTIAFDAVEPFFQRHKNVTRLDVKLAAQSAKLVGSAYRDLRLEKRSGGVQLDVLVRARIRFKVGLWKSQHRTLKVSCSPVLVHFSRAKSFERTYCDVDL